MNKALPFFLLLFLTFSISAQDLQHHFFENLKWINENPTPPDDKKFIFTSADLIQFQLQHYPDFYANYDFSSALAPLIKGHKYERYFEVVYTYNQLAYRLKNENQYSKLGSTLYSVKKMLQSYGEIVEQSPHLRIELLDKFRKMNEEELQQEIQNFI